MKKEIQKISEKLIAASKGISVTADISWKSSVKKHFFESGFKSLPENLEYVSIHYDPLEKIGLFEEIIEETEQLLGNNPVAAILKKTALGWIAALKLIQSRGTADVYEFSKTLYGHPNQNIPGSNKTVLEAAKTLAALAEKISDNSNHVTAREMKQDLEMRLGMYFGDDRPVIHLVQNMSSDAAAGGGMIIIRSTAKLTDKDIDVFEKHEGWVHIGVEVNGKKQPYAKWLQQVSPRTEGVQEGLAAFIEFITGATYSKRIAKLANRVIAIDMIEKGANFIEMFHWHKNLGMDNDLAWNSTERLFKGSLVGGGLPFTRDVSYLKNMLSIFLTVKKLMKSGHSELIEQFFNGYVTISDLPVLLTLQKQGILVPPKYVPEMLRKEKLQNLQTILKNIHILQKVV